MAAWRDFRSLGCGLGVPGGECAMAWGTPRGPWTAGRAWSAEHAGKWSALPMAVPYASEWAPSRRSDGV
jgi:hypothetical protein